MLMPQLGPLPTPDLRAYRVPLWVEDEEYTVQLTKNKLRMYDSETLPDFIKASMSMIHAFPFTPVQDGSLWATSYHNPQDLKLNDIGWRCTWNLYMLILTPEQLESMDG